MREAERYQARSEEYAQHEEDEPAASVSAAVCAESMGAIASRRVLILKYLEKRRVHDAWLVAHSLALLALCKSNCNAQAVTSQSITYYLCKYTTKPNKENAFNLQNAVEGAEKVLLRAGSLASQAAGGEASSTSTSESIKEEERRSEFRRGLSVLCSAVREHTKEESIGGPRASFANLRQELYISSHKFANLMLAQGLAVMEKKPVGGRIRHGVFVSSIEDYLHRPVCLSDVSIFSDALQSRRLTARGSDSSQARAVRFPG